MGADWSSLKSPETYVGHHKVENLASPGGFLWRTRVTSMPFRLAYASINGRSPVSGR